MACVEIREWSHDQMIPPEMDGYVIFQIGSWVSHRRIILIYRSYHRRWMMVILVSLIWAERTLDIMVWCLLGYSPETTALMKSTILLLQVTLCGSLLCHCCCHQTFAHTITCECLSISLSFLTYWLPWLTLFVTLALNFQSQIFNLLCHRKIATHISIVC